MVFNSFAFAPFLVLAVGSQLLKLPWKIRKACLIAISYLFYAAWFPWALSLLLASTLFDFHVAKKLESTRVDRPRLSRMLILGSITLNLGVLFSFKYLGFAVHNLNAVLTALGTAPVHYEPHTVLPVGISFYTFMSLSYVTDVYRGQRQAERSLLDFALFLTFFPHLVAGPIVRAEEFLPQCKTERRPSVDAVTWGALLLLLGLFGKVVLADSWFAPIADRVFSAPMKQVTTLDAWIGAIAFSCQIFCDFAGYSTCAIGAAACLGFRLPDNFRSPYTALGFSDFWRRWHITLSRWLRDYVYITLGGNRAGTTRTFINLMLTMLIGGLWHGASWTYVIWGGLHGVFLGVERLFRAQVEQLLATGLGKLVVAGLTWLAVTWAWVFFRAPSFHVALSLTARLCGLGHGVGHMVNRYDVALVGALAAALFGAQWLTRDRDLSELAERVPRPVLVGLVGSLIVAVLTMAGEDRAFIYFQF